MKLAITVLALFVVVNAAIRGVHPSQEALYSGDLKCDDKVVSHDKINDEFCDCERDGLDEPGTSACKNARFYCRNEGFRGQYIFTSNVNDGICDCCDGSDEFSSGAACTNTCAQLGDALRKQYMGDATEIESGLKARESMIVSAQTELTEKQNKLNSIKSEIEAQEALVERMRVAKDAAELLERTEREAREQIEKAEREAREAAQAAESVNAVIAGSEPPSSVADSASHASTEQAAQPAADPEQAPHAPETAQPTEEAAFPYPKEYMAPPTGEPTPTEAPAADASAFPYPAEYAPQPTAEHAEAPADASAFPYPAEYAPQPAAAEQYTEEPAQVFEDDTPMTQPETVSQESASKDYSSHPNLHNSEYNAPSSNDDDDEGEDAPTVAFPGLSNMLRSISQFFNSLFGSDSDSLPKDEGFSSSYTPPPAAERTPAQVAADNARSEFNSAESALNSLKSQMRDLESYANLDFGPERALASLYKQCVSTQIRQYTYEVCFFDKASQKEGGSSTSLGSWSSWREGEQHREMRFEGGQTCWNGPARSAQITLRCGAADGAVARIVSVEEPSKCVYSMVVVTPAACQQSSLEDVQHKLNAAFAEDVRPKGHALKDEL